MPGNHRSHKGEVTVKRQRSNNLAVVQEFLKAKNIKNEMVLDFICFEHKKRSYRVRFITEAKEAIGIRTY